MIQRIQSVYLHVAAPLMFSFLFLPFAQFVTPDGMLRFDAASLSPIAGMESSLLSVSVSTWGVFILTALIAVLAVITIFLYKNRPLQAKLCIVNTFFMLTLYIVIFVYGYEFKSDFHAEEISWSVYMIFPLLAMILSCIAYRYINKDEQLVKSYDRIR